MRFALPRLVGCLALLLWLSSALVALAAPRKAILLVCDSGDRAVTVRFQAMVAHIKSLRAEGHFGGRGVEKQIKVYDFHLPDHARSLQLLGLKRAADCPYLALISLDARGLPAKVLWGMRYTAPDLATLKLDAALGMHSRTAETVGLVLGQDAANSGLAPLTSRLRQKLEAGMPDLDRSQRMSRKFSELSYQDPGQGEQLLALGLERSQAPWLAVVRFEKGMPREVLWSTSVKQVDQSWRSLQAYVEDTRQAVSKLAVIIVGEPGGNERLYYSLEGKLEQLLNRHLLPTVEASIVNVQESSKLAVEKHAAPVLALVHLDANRRPGKLEWALEVVKEDDALSALCLQLGTTYTPPDEFVYPKDGSLMRRIDGGSFEMGSSEERTHPEDGPAQMVTVNPFYLAKLEVTNEQFSRFVSATNYQTEAEGKGGSFLFHDGKFAQVAQASWRSPAGQGSSAEAQLPVVHVTYNDAEAYCKWAGLRLPGEVEWERAARGSDRRAFPWGNQFQPANLRSSVGQQLGGAGAPTRVGSFAAGASPFGILDMAGNVYEWVDSLFLAYPGNHTADRRFDGNTRIVRGGSWGNQDAPDFHTYHRTAAAPRESQAAIGFRVAL